MRIRRSSFLAFLTLHFQPFFVTVTNITVHIASTFGAGQIIFSMEEGKDGV